MAKRRKIKSRKERVLKPIHAPGVNFLELKKFQDKGKRDKVAAKLEENYRWARDWRVTKRDSWLEAYELFRNYDRGLAGKPDWMSAIFVPKVYEFIMTELPKLMSAVHDEEPLFTATPTDGKFLETADAAEQLLQARVIQTEQFQTHYDLFLQLLMYGTAIGKGTYEYRMDYEGPDFNSTDLFDIYFDPTNIDVQKMKFIIHREAKRIQEVRDMERLGLYRFVNDAIDEKGRNPINYLSGLDRDRITGGGSTVPALLEDFLEIKEHWTTWVDDDTKEEFDVIAVVANQKHLIRLEENPYMLWNAQQQYHYALKPFVKFTNVRLPHEAYGIGEIEIIKQLQYETNDKRNLINDSLAMTAIPTYQILDGALDDDEELIMQPGATFKVRDPNAVTPMKKDMSWGQFYPALDMSKADMQDALGLQDPVRGAEGKRRKTAREFLGLLSELNQRLKLKIQLMAHTLKNQADMMFNMDSQFTDGEVMVSVYENEVFKATLAIQPKQLEFDGKFALNTASLYGSQQITAAARIEFANTLAQMPPETLQGVNFTELLRLIADSLGVKSSKLFVDIKRPELAPVAAAEAAEAATPGQAFDNVSPSGLTPFPNASPEEQRSIVTEIFGGAQAA